MTMPADPRVAKLSEMGEHAYRLGMRVAAEAEREKDIKVAIEWIRLFDRCFFSYRVSIALQLRLERPRPEPREAASDCEHLIDREDTDPPEHDERPERPERYDERDRDRETERASLPILLKTLEGVVAGASALPGPEPAELPTLRELLAHAKAASPPPAPGLRSRLTGSAAPAPPPAPPHRASNVGQILAARRATGPPRR